MGQHRVLGYTADQFERDYAERCGMTIAELRGYGRIVLTCDCDDDLCQGWQSARFYGHDEDSTAPGAAATGEG